MLITHYNVFPDFRYKYKQKILNFNSLRYCSLIFVALFLSVIAGGCITDSFTTSPSDLLTFSREKVDFDTIFTGEGSTTARLVVSNRASKALNITSIRLAADDSYFAVNVDGVSGTVFHDVEIRANDSIYIFIECRPPVTDDVEPYRIEDKLLFVTNGVEQALPIEADAWNVTRLRAEVLTADTRLSSTAPYVVYDSLVVAKDVTLTIDPGVRMLFHDGARLRVHGSLQAVGTPEKIIEFGGDRIDDVLPDVGYDVLAGQWAGIEFTETSSGNSLEYVDIHSTEFGVTVAPVESLAEPSLYLRNSWLHNSRGSALAARYARIEAVGVCFSEAGAGVIDLTGGEHSFLQCTFANNYLFAVPSDPLLTLHHVLPSAPDSDLPFMSATFRNCILYSTMTGDINIDNLGGSNVYLQRCSLRSNGSNDDNFIDCLWDVDPLFFAVREDYDFNYHLQPESPVLHSADGSFITPAAEVDMDGINRWTFGTPALGAYAQ